MPIRFGAPDGGATCTAADKSRLRALRDLIEAAPPAEIALPCRARGPDLWFADRPAELDLAKTLCQGCPVRADCLAGARHRREPWGVWGGEIFERGVIVPRKRPRGRPAKAVRVVDADVCGGRPG